MLACRSEPDGDSTSRSGEDWDCSNQCPPGVFKKATRAAALLQATRPGALQGLAHDTEPGRLEVIKNLRITDDAARMYLTEDQ
eukprot:COSAG06_NODE_9595_length_1862_cov_4.284742_2_plen_83_part_00